jgi:hypothetical protein
MKEDPHERHLHTAEALATGAGGIPTVNPGASAFVGRPRGSLSHRETEWCSPRRIR